MLACTSPTDMKMQLELPFKSDFFWHTEEWLKYDISVNWSLYNWKFKVKVFFHITDAVISTFVFNSRKKATQLQEENKWVFKNVLWTGCFRFPLHYSSSQSLPGHDNSQDTARTIPHPQAALFCVLWFTKRTKCTGNVPHGQQSESQRFYEWGSGTP